MTPLKTSIASIEKRPTATPASDGSNAAPPSPLSEAVAEMNRYSVRKLVFKDGKIPEKQVVGVFEAGDVDGFVKAMELNDIARRVSTSDDEILLSGNQ